MEELLFQIGSHYLSKMDFLQWSGKEESGPNILCWDGEKGGCRRKDLAHISVQSSALLVLLTRDITMLIISTLHLHDNDCVIIFPWSRVVDCGYISFSVQLLGKIVFHLLFRVSHHLFQWLFKMPLLDFFSHNEMLCQSSSFWAPPQPSERTPQFSSLNSFLMPGTYRAF